MARLVGGTVVEAGYYLNTRSMALANLEDRGPLPGTEAERYLPVPWPVALLAAPFVGGIYVLAYPIAGAASMLYGLAKKLAGAAGRGAKDLAATVAPGHAVGSAYMTGKPGTGKPAEDAELEKLEKELAERRKGKG